MKEQDWKPLEMEGWTAFLESLKSKLIAGVEVIFFFNYIGIMIF